MLKIEKTSSIANRRLKVLVYGPPGAGKTRFAGTAIKNFKPIILSAEAGLLSLQGMGDFDFVQVSRWETVEEIRNELRYGKLPYDTVILDSLTEIQQICMDGILREEKRDKAQIQDWGSLGLRMAQTIRDLRDLDCNLIVTALSETDKDEETSEQRTLPMLQGRIRENVAQYFDEVFYLRSKLIKDAASGEVTTERKLITGGTNKITAKDRSGRLAMYEAPDFCAIYEKVFSTKGQ
jgi:phage nucleotide-binding protein